jgi:hypothetical protein
MRQKIYSRELGTTCPNVVRAMESTAIQAGTALLGDIWFASVKVLRGFMCIVNVSKCL